jgi:hypothetical protein
MRVTLRKQDTIAGAGAELFALCSTITADGSISEAEIEQLQVWLHQNQKTDLPAVGFLCDTVNRIVADRRVTPEEKTELHQALERILPKELREVSKAHRRARKAQEAEEARKNAPVAYYDFMVAGVHYEGRGELVRRYARDGQRVYLLRDPGNRYSRNATKVVLSNGVCVGFVPEEDATTLAPLLDSGHKQAAHIKKILRGGTVPIPVIVTDIYAPSATAEAALLATVDHIPSPPPNAALKPQRRFAESCGIGCVILLVVIFLLFALRC